MNNRHKKQIYPQAKEPFSHVPGGCFTSRKFENPCFVDLNQNTSVYIQGTCVNVVYHVFVICFQMWCVVFVCGICLVCESMLLVCMV